MRVSALEGKVASIYNDFNNQVAMAMAVEMALEMTMEMEMAMCIHKDINALPIRKPP